MNTFTFNGTTAESVGLVASGGATFGAPARVQQAVEVPGRNGDLLIDGGRWSNISIVYHCYGINAASNRDDIAEWLSATGYHQLTDDWNASVFRLGYFVGPLDFDMFLAKHGEVDLEFSCKPQRFLLTGLTTTTLTASGTITNPTSFASKPLLRVYGTGTLTVNGTEITISTNASYTDIDCELMDCYCGSTNCNANVTLDEFPELSAGSNTITLDGITSVVITPRWWML